MIDENNFNALVDALRSHPQCCALIVWQPEDCKEFDIDPDAVSWKYVEDAGVEAGFRVLEYEAQ